MGSEAGCTTGYKTACLIILAYLSMLCPAAFAGEIEDACEELVMDYAFHRDRLDATAVAGLFTPDAVLEVNGDVFDGRAAIQARLENSKRAADGVNTRHLMSTVRIFVKDDAHATGISYVTVYGAPKGTLPAEVEKYLAIGEYHDEFVLTPQGWKIANRRFVPLFR